MHTSEKHKDLQKHYLPSPFTALYLNTDYEISKQPHILDMLEEVHHIAETIPGDVDLGYVDFKVKHNDIAFVSSGAWLFQVRLYKSYKKTHTNFKDWCNDVLHKSYNTVIRLIKASTVWIELATMGFDILPNSISQCLVLYDLTSEELYEAWCKVLDNLEPHQITAGSISILLFGDTKKISTSVNLPVDLFNALWSIADHVKSRIVDVITFMYHEVFTKVSNVEPEKIQKWEDDLQDLVSNHEAEVINL